MYSWKQRLRRDDRHSSHCPLPTEMSAPWLLCMVSHAGAHQIWGCRAQGDCCWVSGYCWSTRCCHSCSCCSSALLTRSLSPWWDSLQAETKQRGKGSCYYPFACLFFLKKNHQQAMLSLTTLGIRGLVCPTLLEESLHESNTVTYRMAELLPLQCLPRGIST